VTVLPETDPTIPAMRSLAWAAGAGLDDAADDEDVLAAAGLLLEALDDADGVEDDPQAASAKAASPARATALQRDGRRDGRVEVGMPLTVLDAPVRAL
jgi:hypothetical protein